MDDLSIMSGSDSNILYNDKTGSSSSQSLQLLEDQSQTISQEQQSSKSIKMASNATILDGTFLN
ncbi:Hypothetical protein CINCED_3A017265 [Cinara cedri]|uniref:Uncharacterized protein n=1 Tax=Cinara cedri TaxID=506608 RepID=A0A5E4MF12_9HEMI|nr:Hypothetical protein CINCED_3A017265 [Cinara cedri]